MKYYKVNLGYSEFISVDETELEKVVNAQMTGSITIVNAGTVNGKYISHITPDYHRALGLNYGYKLEAEDYADFRRIDKEYQSSFSNILEAAKLKQLQ